MQSIPLFRGKKTTTKKKRKANNSHLCGQAKCGNSSALYRDELNVFKHRSVAREHAALRTRLLLL